MRIIVTRKGLQTANLYPGKIAIIKEGLAGLTRRGWDAL